MKLKPLKLWQGILLSIVAVFLAVGGAFLYVYLTSGIGPQTIYPEEISFVIDENEEGYNATSGQYEKAEDFFVTISTATENVSEKMLTLSFTVNFTDPEISDRVGYITDGNITIPHQIEIGKPFKIEVNKEEVEINGETVLVNKGGISNIYAKTTNKTMLPINTKVAIDVPVEQINTKVVDLLGNDVELDDETNRFNITEGTDFRISTIYTPQNSVYVYGDKEVKKQIYYEILEGSENFSMHTDNDGVYFSADGDLKKTGKIKVYSFKNASDQIAFNAQHISDTETQIYNSALLYLSNNKDKAETSEVELVIVQANVKYFSVSRKDDLNLTTNKLYRITAGDSQSSDINLGVNIFDSTYDGGLGKNLTSMIKNIAVRTLKKYGDQYLETNEVKVEGGQPVKLADNDTRHYTFINSSVRDLKNAYFEVSSTLTGDYYLEFVLMRNDISSEVDQYYVFKEENVEKTEIIAINFSEGVETGIGWKDSSDIEIVIYSGQDIGSEYSKNLTELISVSPNNHYQTVIFFADFKEMDPTEVSNYINYKPQGESVFGQYTIQDQVYKLYELSSSNLIVKTGGNFEIRFAVVVTDAYGEMLKNQDGTYKISQMSTPVKVTAIETVSGLSSETVSLDISQEYKYTDEEGLSYYVVPVDAGSFNLEVNLNEADANLMEMQKERFSVYAYDVDRQEVLLDVLNVSDAVRDGNKFVYTLSFKARALEEKDYLKANISLVYTTPIMTTTVTVGVNDNEVNKDRSYLTVYKRSPSKIDYSSITTDDINEYQYQISQKIEGGGYGDITIIPTKGQTTGNGISVTAFNSKLSELKVLDEYDKDITSVYPISLTSDNTNLITIVDNQILVASGVTEGSCRIYITSGPVQIQLTFIAGAASITKLIGYSDNLNDLTQNPLPTIASEQTDNVSSITVEKLGYKGANINLASLVEIYVDESTTLSAIEFRFPSIITMSSDDKKYLFGSTSYDKGMITAKSNGQKLLGDKQEGELDNIITFQSAITDLVINNDFGQDLTLAFNIVGVNSGVNISLNLIIKSNIDSAVKNFEGIYNAGIENPANDEIDSSYVGVYAQYPIDLNETVVVNKKYPLASGEKQVINWTRKTDSIQVTVDDGVVSYMINGESYYHAGENAEGSNLLFDDVYKASNIDFDLYEIEDNPYSYNTKLKFRVYPNLKLATEKSTLEFTKIAGNNSESLTSYFKIERFVWAHQDELIPSLSYSVSDNVPVAINNDSFTMNGELEFNYGETSREFVVSVLNNSTKVNDYKDEALDLSMNLVLGITYENIANKNAWMDIVTFDGMKMALIDYTGSVVNFINDNDEYTFNVLANIGVISKISNTSFTALMNNNDNALKYGERIYLPLRMYNSSSIEVAIIKIPLIISSIGKDFAYYRSYNKDTNGFDLHTLLAEDLNNLPDNFAVEFEAGEETQLVYKQEYTEEVEKKENLKVLSFDGENLIVTYEENSVTYVATTTIDKLKVTTKQNINGSIEGIAGQPVIPSGSVVKISNYDSSNNTYRVEYIDEGIVITKENIGEDENSIAANTVVSVTPNADNPDNYDVTYNDITVTNVTAENLTFGATVYARDISKDDLNIITEAGIVTLVENITLKAISHDTTQNYEGIYYDSKKATIDISIVQNVLTDGVYLAEYDAETGILKINNLAGDNEEYIILKVTLSNIGNPLTYYYKVKVVPNRQLSVTYPNDGDIEYISMTESPKQIDLSDNRFVIKDKDNITLTNASTNSVKSIKIGDKLYTVGGANNLAFEETNGVKTYTVYGNIVVTLSGNNYDTMNITLSDYDTSIELVVTKTYTDVVYGSVDYKFGINMSGYIYSMSYGESGEVEESWTAYPQGEKELVVKTKRTSKRDLSSTGDVPVSEVETTFTYKYNLEGKGYTSSVSDNIITIKQNNTAFATITYDYQNKKLTTNVTGPVTDEHHITFTFAVVVKDVTTGEVKAGQTNVGTITVVIPKTIIIEEAETQLCGGMTYNVNALVSNIKVFNEGNKIYENSSDKTATIKEDSSYKFITVDTTAGTFTTAMLNADKDVKFVIEVEDGGNTYSYTILRTIKQNVTYTNNAAFTDNVSSAPTISYTGTYYAGDNAEINFTDYAKLLNGQLVLESGTDVTIDYSNDNTHTISYTSAGKTYTAVVEKSRIDENNKLTEKTTLYSESSNLGEYSATVVGTKGSEGYVTIGGVDVKAEVTENVNFKLQTGDIPADTSIIVPVQVTYESGSFNFTYCIKVSITVKKNTIATVHYPNPTKTHEMSYETVGTTTITIDSNKTLTIISIDGENAVVRIEESGKVYQTTIKLNDLQLNASSGIAKTNKVIALKIANDSEVTLSEYNVNANTYTVTDASGNVIKGVLANDLVITATTIENLTSDDPEVTISSGAEVTLSEYDPESDTYTVTYIDENGNPQSISNVPAEKLTDITAKTNKEIALTIANDSEVTLSEYNVNANTYTVTDASGNVIKGVLANDLVITVGSKVNLKTGTRSLTGFTISNIADFFVNQKHEFAEDSTTRVKFVSADPTNTNYTVDSSEVKISVLNASNIKGITTNSTWTGNVNVTLALEASNIAGEITFGVTYKAVTEYYTLYVVPGSEYIIDQNETINVSSGVETIYPDALEDNKILKNDRIVKLTFQNGLSSLDQKVMHVEFKKGADTYSFSFRYDDDRYSGATKYFEAGQSLSGYEYSRTYYILNGAENEITPFEVDPVTTERIVAFYRTKTENIQIDKSYLTGKVGSTEFKDYSIPTSAIIGNDIVASYNIYIGTSIGTSSIGSGTYNYKLDLDVKVENDIDNKGLITIKATDMNTVVDLISAAGIYHPSTGEYITADDFTSTSNISSSVVIYNKSISEHNAYSSYVDKYINNNSSASDAINKSMESSARFLSYEEQKAGEDANAKAYNFKLIGEGAANDGSYAMIIYTYKKGDLAKTFYIMVKILPDYNIFVDGNTITSTANDGSSTSTNETSAYQVSYNENQYLINLTNKTNSDGIVKVIKRNSSSQNDIASSWTYTLTANEENGKYNTDLDKLKYTDASSTSLPTTPSKGWSKDGESTTTYTWEGGDNLTISKTAPNTFGTKYYKLKMTNEYGYEAYIYFTFKPTNDKDPVITSAFDSIKEEETFDIGAIYDNLSMESAGWRLVATNKVKSSSDNIFSDYETIGVKYKLTYKDNDITYYATVNDTEFNKATYKLNCDVTFTSDPYILSSDQKTLTLTAEQGSTTTTYSVTSTPLDNISNGLKATFNTKGSSNEVTFVTGGAVEFSSVKPLYTLVITSANNAPTKSEFENVINIGGINAWGYRDEIASFTTDQVTNYNSYKDYLTPDKMTLNKIAVNSIVFYFNNINVGHVEFDESGTSSATRTLATSENLNLLQAGTGADDGKLITASNNDAFRKLKNNFVMPKLKSWIYSYGGNSSINIGGPYPEQDSQQVTMTITLQYGSGSDAETYQVSKVIQVTRSKKIDRTKEGFVQDGEVFTLKDTNLFSGTGSNKYYFAGESGESITEKFLDDTLVVTLPAAVGSNYQRIQINAVVKDSDGLEKAKFKNPITLENSKSRVQTFYVFISENLVAYDNESQGYILKENDTIKFTFSGYESNGSVDGKENSEYQYFYAKYGGVRLCSYVKESVSYGTNTIYANKQVILSNYNSENKTYTVKTTGENPVSVEGVSEDNIYYLTTSNQEVTVSAITQDTINIEDSEMFGSSGVASIIKSYIIDGYRVEKEYFVTPYIYSTDMNYETITTAVKTNGDALNGYTVNLETWSTNITLYGIYGPSKNSTTSAVMKNNSDPQGNLTLSDVSSKLKFAIGSNIASGTSKIDNGGTITTRSGYELGGDEFIHVCVYVKASGFDGTFAKEDSDDYMLGQVRVFVTES